MKQPIMIEIVRILAFIAAFVILSVSDCYPDEASSTSPDGIRVVLKAKSSHRTYERKDEIRFQVDIKNESADDVAVCLEKWTAPVGLVSLRVKDAHGKAVRRVDGLEVFDQVGKDVLVELSAGASVRGVLDLGAWERVYDFGKGAYSVRAVYYCPLRGEVEIGGKRLRVISGELESNTVRIDVDYEGMKYPSETQRLN